MALTPQQAARLIAHENLALALIRRAVTDLERAAGLLNDVEPAGWDTSALRETADRATAYGDDVEMYLAAQGTLAQDKVPADLDAAAEGVA